MRAPRLTALLLLLPLACAKPLILVPDAVNVRVGSISTEQLEQSVSQLTRSIDERSDLLADAFREAGCPPDALETLAGSRGDNIICTLPGSTPWMIVVAANVDRPSEGPGIIDNGTGMVLLPLLYKALRVEPRQHTFVFAGFTDAFIKQRGARRYLREIGSEGRSRTRAMVQLKALGLGPTAMWGAKADANLRQDLFSVSRALDLPLRNVGFHENVVLDAKAFRVAGIPTITVHSLDRSSARLLEQPYRDPGASAIDWASFESSARLLAFYLAYLDLTLQLRVDSVPSETEHAPAPL